MAHTWLPLLLLRAQAQAYTNDNDDAWINAPRSGSILTSERVDVALALRPSADTKQRVACLSTEQRDVADPSTSSCSVLKHATASMSRWKIIRPKSWKRARR